VQRIAVAAVLIVLFVWNVKQCNRIEALENKSAIVCADRQEEMLTMSIQIHKLTNNQERFVNKIEYMIDMYYSVQTMREEMLKLHGAIMEAQYMCVDHTKRSTP